MGLLGKIRYGLSSIDPLDLLGGKSAKAAEEQKQAQEDALASQQAEANQARGTLGGLTEQGRQDITGYNERAAGSLSDMYGQAQAYMGDSGNALADGYGQARSDYQGLMAQGEALGRKMDKPVDLSQDPGMQFRQQQGEQALMRFQAAKGGRLSTGAMKELMNYNSGLASQEYGNAFNRQQAQNAQGMQLLGQQYGLGSQMAGSAAQQGQMSSGLMANQAQMAQSQGGALADVYSNTGANLGNLSTSLGGQYTGLAQGMMGAQQNYAQYGGLENQNAANQAAQNRGTAVTVIAAL